MGSFCFFKKLQIVVFPDAIPPVIPTTIIEILFLIACLFSLSILQSSSLDFDGSGDYVGVSNPVNIPDGFEPLRVYVDLKQHDGEKLKLHRVFEWHTGET